MRVRLRRLLRASRWQLGSMAAVVLGFAIVIGAQALDGGTVRSLFQLRAALIVFGGTLAATLISYSPRAILDAIRAAGRTFARQEDTLDTLSAQLVSWSIRAHRRGLLSLEPEVDAVRDPFLRNGLMLAIDGASSEMLRDVLNVERLAQEGRDEVPVRIFEAAAGYAPTLGILGAVLGLIHVMENLTSPAKLGPGIAVAFVATIYGVGVANLVFLPLATKLRAVARAAVLTREIIIEGVGAIQRNMNPRRVEEHLAAYVVVRKREHEAAA